MHNTAAAALLAAAVLTVAAAAPAAAAANPNGTGLVQLIGVTLLDSFAVSD